MELNYNSSSDNIFVYDRTPNKTIWSYSELKIPPAINYDIKTCVTDNSRFCKRCSYPHSVHT